MKRQRPLAALIMCVCILGLAGMTAAQERSENQTRPENVHAKTQSEGAGAPEIIPHRRNQHGAGAPTAGSISTITPTISYHGGTVMEAPSIYLIWYGNWKQSNNSDTASGQQLVRDFLHGLSGSGYYATNTTYYDSVGHRPSGTFFVAGEYTDSYSQGTSLSDKQVQAVVTNAIKSGKLGIANSSGIYFVLTSSDVSESSGFCSKYCGWHTSGTISGLNIKYSFVGNANRCLSSCAAQTVGPNGNAGVDAMVSVVAHELEETNTDPNGNAWYDSAGAEDADKCAWTFGSHLNRAPNGAYYNMVLPGLTGNFRYFLVQRELDANSMCFVDFLKQIQ